MDNTICYEDYFVALHPRLGEREYRLVSSALAKHMPRGGVSLVARTSGLSRPTIYSGMRELDTDAPVSCAPEKQRKDGGGRKAWSSKTKRWRMSCAG